MKFWLIGAFVVIVGIGYYIVSSPYRMQRIQTWFESYQKVPENSK